VHIADANADGYAAESYTHCHGDGNPDSTSYGYTYRDGYGHTYRDADWYTYTQLHTRLVCGRAAPNPRCTRGWRLFPGQREVLCDGRAFNRPGGQRFHAPI
jgi:hypothetical protein